MLIFGVWSAFPGAECLYESFYLLQCMYIFNAFSLNSIQNEIQLLKMLHPNSRVTVVKFSLYRLYREITSDNQLHLVNRLSFDKISNKMYLLGI